MERLDFFVPCVPFKSVVGRGTDHSPDANSSLNLPDRHMDQLGSVRAWIPDPNLSGEPGHTTDDSLSVFGEEFRSKMFGAGLCTI